MKWLLVALAVLAVAPLGAQAGLHQEDQGFALLRHPVTSGAQYARCLRENDPSCLRATRGEILRSFQLTHPSWGLRTWEELAYRMDTWLYRPCPAGTKVRLSRILIPSRTVDAVWSRPYRDGEYCFIDNNEGIVVASASCGNGDADHTPYRAEMSLSDREQEHELRVPDIDRLKDSIAGLNREIDRLRTPPPVYRDAPPRVDTIKVTAFDSVKVYSSRGIEGPFITRSAIVPISGTSIVADVTILPADRKGSSFLTKAGYFTAGVVAGGLGGWYLNDHYHSCCCGCPEVDDWTPQNPPNLVSRREPALRLGFNKSF